MIDFKLRSDREQFVSEIRNKGLYHVIANEIANNEVRELLSMVFDETFSKLGLNEFDFDEFENNICEDIEYEVEDIWEVYFDKEEEGEFTNDNYSIFILSEKEPTIEEALRVVKEHDMLQDGYHIRFINESNWDYDDIKKELLVL